MTYQEALKVLELSPNATLDEIKRVYRRMRINITQTKIQTTKLPRIVFVE